MREKIEQMLKEDQARLEAASAYDDFTIANIGGRCEALLDVLALFDQPQ